MVFISISISSIITFTFQTFNFNQSWKLSLELKYGIHWMENGYGWMCLLNRMGENPQLTSLFSNEITDLIGFYAKPDKPSRVLLCPVGWILMIVIWFKSFDRFWFLLKRLKVTQLLICMYWFLFLFWLFSAILSNVTCYVCENLWKSQETPPFTLITMAKEAALTARSVQFTPSMRSSVNCYL